MQGLERVMSILRLLAARKRPCRLTDIAAGVGLTKPTTLRLLGALCEQRMVDEDRVEKTYQLGRELVFLGWASEYTFDLPRRALPAIEWLADETGDTAYLSVRSGNHSVCAGRVLGRYPVQALTMDVGNRRPLGVGAASLAILSALPDAEIAEVLQENTALYPDFPGGDPSRLLEEVKATRKRGYALTKDHLVRGVSAASTPVLDRNGYPFASVGVAAVNNRFDARRVDLLIAACRKSASMVCDAVLGPGTPQRRWGSLAAACR